MGKTDISLHYTIIAHNIWIQRCLESNMSA